MTHIASGASRQPSVEGFQPVSKEWAKDVRLLLTSAPSQKYINNDPGGYGPWTVTEVTKSCCGDGVIQQTCKAGKADPANPDAIETFSINFKEVGAGPYHFRALIDGQLAEDQHGTLGNVMNRIRHAAQVTPTRS